MKNCIALALASVAVSLSNHKVNALGGGSMAPAPDVEMYKELIYIEKDCIFYNEREFNPDAEEAVNITNGDLVQVGDSRTFECDLYEAATNFGQYGANKVGKTFWYCYILSIALDVQASITVNLGNIAIWDCTITDYVGGDLSSLRNEGTTVFITDPNDEDDPQWRNFHSHTGTFATVGGTGLGKGARGEMEVQWDHYLMTWVHIYMIEVWSLDQPKLYLPGSGH